MRARMSAGSSSRLGTGKRLIRLSSLIEAILLVTPGPNPQETRRSRPGPPPSSSNIGGMEPFALPIETMRARRGIKWRRYGDGVLPAFIADMDFAVADPVQRAI